LIWKGKNSSTKAQSKGTQGISLYIANQSFPSRIADLIAKGKRIAQEPNNISRLQKSATDPVYFPKILQNILYSPSHQIL
jgi:hypothetical protein